MVQDPRHRSNTAGPAEPALDPAGPHRDTAGRILRRGRERERLSLRDVAGALRIRYDYLDAIECSDFDRLPGATYAIGFVRSYAGYLELDDEEIVRRFKQEVHGLNRTQDLSFPEPVNEGKVPGKALLLISLMLVGVAYGGWHYLSQSPDRRISDMVPAVPDRLKAFLDDGGSGAPTGEKGDANVTEFAEAPDAANGGGDRGQATVSEPSGQSRSGGGTPGTQTTRAPQSGTDETSVSAGDRESAAGASDADEAVTNGATGSTGVDTTNTPAGGTPNADGGAGDVPATPETPADVTETARGASTSAPDGASGEATDAGTVSSDTPMRDEPSGTDATATTATDGDEPASAAPDAPSSARAEGDAGASQTTSVSDAPDSGGEPTANGGSGDAVNAAAGDDGAPAQATPSGDTGGSGDSGTATNGIPEPPTPDDDTTVASDTGTPETQRASLPDAPGSTANGATSSGRGAQADVLGEAKRVFGAENGSSRMVLRATQDSWVQVHGANDGPLLTRVLNPGDVYRVPDRDDLVLHTGNAGGLEVFIDGNPAGSLGQTGEVKRNVALSPDALR
jgi:cytoskeletal protein RodZ